ncbi:MAG: 2-succinyl-5-enolpyruvyl-6-hydroxy-3-cyclohexene-1-carboxylic-acid synthase [Actinobacteria bacterium]|nr:MAG: 2-succinyl-5-enolpyruvyl-6-hydroxy-3-cyclohexene-1-carboxylic-acid synthase [Actinomycetota bacterium]
MAEPTAGDIAFACMRELVDELHQGGVDAVCISPGSRSTPLVLAFARHGAFDVRVILDERSAAFFALGRARATGKPAALVCTSGTATANYLPAIVEASMSNVPMIVLTADRTPSLRGTGANQTIDQHQLYGGYVRMFMETGVPRAHAHAAKMWRTLARRAVETAQTGPIHINMPFEEPLTPTGAEVDLGTTDPKPPQNLTTPSINVESFRDLLLSERGAIVAGQIDDDAQAVAALAEHLGWPLIAEPLSGLRVPGDALSAGQALLGDDRFAEQHAPEAVLQFGRTPTSRATQRFVAAAARLGVIGERPADPAKAAKQTLSAPEGAAARALIKLVSENDGTWLKEWRDADAVARGALDTFLDGEKQPFEIRVARDVAAAVPDGTTLVVASSTPVRDLDFAMGPREGLRVIANRGASGIDGFVSTVLGVASAGSPTVALAGDLSVLHDAAGLLWVARRGEPVIFVVLNNKGGGIFDLLPSAALPENDALFATAHEIDLRALAAAAGIGYETGTDLAAFLKEAPTTATLFEVPIDRARAVKRRKALKKAIASALSAAG